MDANHTLSCLSVLNNLGSKCYSNLGDFEGAKTYVERALTIDEAVYGPNHSKVANDVNNLGVICFRPWGIWRVQKSNLERALNH